MSVSLGLVAQRSSRMSEFDVKISITSFKVSKKISCFKNKPIQLDRSVNLPEILCSFRDLCVK